MNSLTMDMPLEQKRVAIVGCGQMGCDIAAVFLNGGWRVDAVVRDAARIPERRAQIRRAEAVLSAQAGEAMDVSLRFYTNVDAIAWPDIDLVIESLPELFDVKSAIFVRLDALVPFDVPVVTNSSGLRISEIARHCGSSHRMAGLHFFFPAHIAPLVEVVKGEATDEATMHTLLGIMQALERKPVRVNRDIPGFLANRIQHALMRECWSLIDRGLATPEDVDIAVRYGFGFRYIAAGPVLQKELTGLDTQLHAARAIYPSLANDAEPSSVLVNTVAAGRLGVGTGHGIWDWAPGRVRALRQRYADKLVAAAKLLEDA